MMDVRPAVNEREIADAYEVASRVFGPSYEVSRAHKTRLLRLEPPSDTRDVIVAMDGARVVGLVRILDRAVMLDGRDLPVGGVTAVAVEPSLQGQGLGRALVEVSLDRSRARGDVLSIAFARRAVDGFYWRYGYVGVGCHPRVIVRNAPARHSVARVEPGWREDRLDAYRACYAHTYGGLPLAFARDGRGWRVMMARLGWQPAAEVYSVCDGAAVRGYFICVDSVVIEAAGLDHALVRDAIADAAPRTDDAIALALHPQHPVAGAFFAENHESSIRYAWNGGHVARVVDGRAWSAAFDRRVAPAVRQAWGRTDVRDHGRARDLLLAAAGARESSSAPVAPLPHWSAADEF